MSAIIQKEEKRQQKQQQQTENNSSRFSMLELTNKRLVANEAANFLIPQRVDFFFCCSIAPPPAPHHHPSIVNSLNVIFVDDKFLIQRGVWITFNQSCVDCYFSHALDVVDSYYYRW